MKKLLAICLAVLLVCSAMPFAFATAAEEPTVVISEVEAKAGDEVTVTVELKNNPGIISAVVFVGYDADALELVSAANGEFVASNGAGCSYSPLTHNPFQINFYDGVAPQDYTYELLATLTFKVKDGAAAGTYPLTLEFSCEDDFFNSFASGMETVYFGEDEGFIKVVEDEPIVPDEPVYENPTVVLPAINAVAGEEISVPVRLVKNPGIISAVVFVGYDANVLELVSAANGEFVASNGAGCSYSPLTHNPFQINFYDGVAPQDYTYELLATLTFKVKDGAAAGTYPLTLEFSCEDDFFNSFASGMETVYFDEAEGSVTIGGGAPIVPPVCDEHVYDADCDPDCNVCGEIRPVHTEGIIHFDAVEPDCHYNGNIEYWFCPKCEIFWADEALTQLTNSKNVVLPATGSENLQHVEAVEPTCQSEGNIEYWYCPDCDQYWADEALTQLTNRLSVKLGVIDHNIVHFDAIDPGCHYVGNIEYWMCTECEIFWQDAELTQITNSKNVIIPALGGDVVAFEAIEPGCHMNGQIAYWYCPECDQFWQDEALTQLTNSKNVIVPATGSENLQHVEAVEPTCQSEGNIEYWYCPDCDQYWADEALTQLTNRLSVKLGVTDHNIVNVEAVDPGCHYLGNIEYWYCTTCELFWQDAELTQLTNSKNVIIPALGGEVIAFEAIEPGCHMNGQIAYWYCPECAQFWQDEALTQLTNSKNVIVPATGSENLQHVEAKEPTAAENGNIEYWFCPDCEQYWADEALTQLTNSKNVIIPATGEVEEPETPDSPVTGDSSVAVVVALLTLIASGVAVVLLKNKKRA